MPNATKAALEESLKRLLLKKPLDKITITDLTTDCGISRMAFYYHFKDIYDLVEWSCVEDGTKALQGKKTSESWTEGLTQVFEAVLENKPFIMNVYRNVDRERIENYLFKLTYDLIAGVVEEKSKGLDLSDEDKKFIARNERRHRRAGKQDEPDTSQYRDNIHSQLSAGTCRRTCGKIIRIPVTAKLLNRCGYFTKTVG